MVASGTSEDCKGSETKGLRVAPGHAELAAAALARHGARPAVDRKSTRLNSSHVSNSYAVFCLKKKSYHYPHDRIDVDDAGQNAHDETRPGDADHTNADACNDWSLDEAPRMLHCLYQFPASPHY